jgi:DNA-binding LytR/AlgR family response regulator
MLWSYSRFRFSKIDLKPTLTSAEKTCIITGNNSKEEYSFFWNQFLLAKSQSNYVEVYLLDAKTDNTEKIMIRNTLSNLLSQLPEAVQVHRSYIVNIDKIEKLTGNVRKGGCTIFGYSEQVPVSPKHFKALKSGLNIQS